MGPGRAGGGGYGATRRRGLGDGWWPVPSIPCPPLQCCRASRCRRWPSGWRARRTPCVSCGLPAGSSGLTSTPAPSAAEPPQQRRRSPSIYRPVPLLPGGVTPRAHRGQPAPAVRRRRKGRACKDGHLPRPFLHEAEGTLPLITSSNQVLENHHRNHIPGVAGAASRHSPSPAAAVPGERRQPDPGRHRQHWGGPCATHPTLVSRKRTMPREASGTTRGRSGPLALTQRRHAAAHH